MNVILLRADPGYSVIIFNDHEPKNWRIDQCIRLPVVAWEFHENQTMKPRTINPVHDMANDFFVIEAPTGVCVGYHLNTGVQRTVINLKSWIELSILSTTPIEGSPN